MKYDKHEFKHNRAHGWDRNLYRSRENKRIAGVCGGIAEHLNVEPWIIRLLFVGSFFMLGGLSILLYIIAIFAIDKRPKESTISMEYDEEQHQYRPRNAFKYGASTSTRLQKAKQRIDAALERTKRMEAYVTSKQYELNKEFARMQDS
jgi:phage shock protein C